MPFQSCRAVATPGQELIRVVWIGRSKPSPDTAKSAVEAPPGSGTKIPLTDWVAGVTSLAGNEWEVTYQLPPAGDPQPDVRWLVPSHNVGLELAGLSRSVQTISCVVEPVPDGFAQLRDEIRDQLNAANVNAFQTRIGGVVDDLDGVRGDFDDLIGFPLITGVNGSGGGGGPSGGGPAVAGQALVDAEMRRALGRKPSTADVPGTLALLDRSMELVEVDGIQRWEVRSGGALITQAATGAGVTGRQASLASLARDTLEQVKPLVETVQPIVPPTTNPSLTEAHRSSFLAALTDAANETAVDSGPLQAKSLVLLDQALTELRRFGERLGMLERVRGLWVPTRRNVVTPADEDEYTSFLVILDRYVVFDDFFRTYLGRPLQAGTVFDTSQDATRDFGRVFGSLDRHIDVLAEGVRELDAALASVGIDREEREVHEVRDGASIADLMEWAHTFAEHEARPLIHTAGKPAAALLETRLERLRDEFDALQGQIRSGPSRPLRHQRVKIAVRNLVAALRDARDEAHLAAQP